jgi:hypothetical protein
VRRRTEGAGARGQDEGQRGRRAKEEGRKKKERGKKKSEERRTTRDFAFFRLLSFVFHMSFTCAFT